MGQSNSPFIGASSRFTIGSSAVGKYSAQGVELSESAAPNIGENVLSQTTLTLQSDPNPRIPSSSRKGALSTPLSYFLLANNSRPTHLWLAFYSA